MQVIEPFPALDDRLGRIDAGAGGVADIDAETNAAIILLDRAHYVIGGGELLILRAMVVDGKADVELPDQFVEDRNKLFLWCADHGSDTDVACILEGAADLRLIAPQADVADTERSDPGIPEHLRPRTHFPRRQKRV